MISCLIIDIDISFDTISFTLYCGSLGYSRFSITEPLLNNPFGFKNRLGLFGFQVFHEFVQCFFPLVIGE